jgi:hypothetical protein
MDFLTKIGFALAIGGIGLSIALFFAIYIWRDMPRWIAICGFGVGVALCISAFACFIFIPEPERPDVTLRLVYPKQPSLQLENISGVVARQIKYSFALWNLDKETKNPLQIPVATFDFIRAGQYGGPLNIFQPVESTLTIGNRIFGSIGVTCPNCIRGHTFWVYIVWGENGWYSEVPDKTEGEVLVPKNFQHVAITSFAEAMMVKIPEVKRIEISNPY